MLAHACTEQALAQSVPNAREELMHREAEDEAAADSNDESDVAALLVESRLEVVKHVEDN